MANEVKRYVYRLREYSNEIRKFEFVRETEKMIYYKEKWFQRENVTRGDKELFYHSFDSARTALIQRIENKISYHEKEIRSLRADLEKVQVMEEQEAGK